MPLQNMIQLQSLKFNGTPVKRLLYLQNLVNLKVLDFSTTKVSGLTELEGLMKLESVKMFNTKVSAKKVELFKRNHPKCEVVYY